MRNALTTAAMQSVACGNGLQFMRVWLPEPWRKRKSFSDRCKLNRQIKADNALLRELKAEVKKLAGLVIRAIPAVAERLEKLRCKVRIFCYQLAHIRASRVGCQKALDVYKPQLARYTEGM